MSDTSDTDQPTKQPNNRPDDQSNDMNIDQSKRTLLSYWWTLPVLGTVGAFGYMGYYARQVTFGKHQPSTPDYHEKKPLALVPISELQGPYSMHEFTFAQTPCVLLELPAASPSSLTTQDRHFAAYSRLCPHQGCPVHLIADPELLALSYNYRSESPMLGCPCHFSVFDPQAEGASVFGRALYPLPRVQLTERNGVLYAVGLEPDPRIDSGT